MTHWWIDVFGVIHLGLNSNSKTRRTSSRCVGRTSRRDTTSQDTWRPTPADDERDRDLEITGTDLMRNSDYTYIWHNYIRRQITVTYIYNNRLLLVTFLKESSHIRPKIFVKALSLLANIMVTGSMSIKGKQCNWEVLTLACFRFFRNHFALL